MLFPQIGVVTKKRVARAHHLAENNREVSELLFSKHEQHVEPVTESNREGDSERQRKLARMQALRNKQHGPDEAQTLVVILGFLHKIFW